MPRDWIDLLPLVPAVPLAAVVLLALAGGRLPDRVAAWLATGAVGVAFLLSVGVGTAYVGLLPQQEGAPSGPIVRPLWTWIAAGEDLVQVTAALRPLPAGLPVPEDAVGTLWADASRPEVIAQIRDMWDAGAVAGKTVGAQAVPAYAVMTIANVPPEDGAFVEAPRAAQHRFEVRAALQLDGLSLVMMLLVTGVAFLILVYAVGYMDGDEGVRRFFLYMDLFVFSMLVLVLAADFLVLFVGWELVGLCSYLLIGFWFDEPANADAGRKAFIVNRVGDFAFLLGLMLIWSVFGSLAYADVLPNADRLLPLGSGLAAAIALLLVAGATGKSAQLPLFVWLPDAMAGPTPVSALIHAATMVTAGVYMIARAAPLFERAPAVMGLVAAVGVVTALMAALAALVQVDIKRVLAYSTISQLGYMFLAVGAGAYVAGIAHLAGHAFFKALLFLGAGSAMHGIAHGFEATGSHPEARDGVPPEQDMRNMGGLLGRMPLTGWTFLIGVLALAGLFPLVGFFTKDEILYETLAHGDGWASPWGALWALAMLTAFLTALYAGRQLVLVLGGRPRSEGAAHAAESHRTMTMPLVALALLTVLGGLLVLPIAGRAPALAAVLGPVVGGHEVDAPIGKAAMAVLAVTVSMAGLAVAWFVYARGVTDPARVASGLPRLHRTLARAFFVDDLYSVLLVRPFRTVAPWLWRTVDDRWIDGAVNAVGRGSIGLAVLARGAQSGYVRAYALAMILGAAVLVAALFLVAR